MNNEGATEENPGDASRYRFMRTAMWWREISAMRKTTAISTFQTLVKKEEVDDQLLELATTIETAKNVLVHRCLFGSWDVITQQPQNPLAVAREADTMTQDSPSNSGDIVNSLTDKEKEMVLEMQDYLNNLGAYKAIQAVAPEITKIAAQYVPTIPKAIPVNNDHLKSTIANLLQESVDEMDKADKANLLARVKKEEEADWVCTCGKSCSEIPYYCMDCGIDWGPKASSIQIEEKLKAAADKPVIGTAPFPGSAGSPLSPIYPIKQPTFDSIAHNPHYSQTKAAMYDDPSTKFDENAWLE